MLPILEDKLPNCTTEVLDLLEFSCMQLTKCLYTLRAGVLLFFLVEGHAKSPSNRWAFNTNTTTFGRRCRKRVPAWSHNGIGKAWEKQVESQALHMHSHTCPVLVFCFLNFFVFVPACGGEVGGQVSGQPFTRTYTPTPFRHSQPSRLAYFFVF